MTTSDSGSFCGRTVSGGLILVMNTTDKEEIDSDALDSSSNFQPGDVGQKVGRREHQPKTKTVAWDLENVILNSR